MALDSLMRCTMTTDFRNSLICCKKWHEGLTHHGVMGQQDVVASSHILPIISMHDAAIRHDAAA